MKILIAEDNIIARRLLEATLERWGYEPISVGTGDEAWAILQRDNGPFLVILDWIMPGLTGLEVCRLVRQHLRERYTYILLLTSKGDKGDLVEGMDSGADDYIAKPFDHNELKVRLRAGCRIIELQTELLATQEALREQATKDSLTKVWNRLSVLDILEREFLRSQRDGLNLSVGLFDLDYFKNVNDTYGHLAGDTVLYEVSTRVRSTIRRYDALGRYGGEEFIIVLPGCDLQQARQLAERSCRFIAAKPVKCEGAEIHITASFGITTLSPATTEINEMLQLADEALYCAKKDGRNRVVCTPVPDGRSLDGIRLLSANSRRGIHALEVAVAVDPADTNGSVVECQPHTLMVGG